MNILLPNEFNESKLKFSKIDQEAIHHQIYFYPTYDNNPFIFQTEEIKITQYGIPSLGDFYKDDQQRSFIKVPIDKNQINCIELKNFLEKLDTFIINNKTNIIGIYDSSSELTPSVKQPYDPSLDEEDNEDNKIIYQNKMEYCKLKFNLDYQDKFVKTSVFLNQNNQKVIINKSNFSISDICEHFLLVLVLKR